MSSTTLLLIAAGGIAVLLLMVIKFKVNAFVALLLVSLGVALAAGTPAAELVTTIQEGMGQTLGYIAVIIALGAMVGRMIEISGGAKSFAQSLIDRFGERRTPLALTVAGFVLGIPIFFDVGLIILMPIVLGVARVSRKPILLYALPLAGAMLTVHALLPPHPGQVALAGLIGADQGMILLFGIPIAALVSVVGFLLARRLTRREYPIDPDLYERVYGDTDVPDDADGTGGGSTPAAGGGGGSATVLAPAPTGTKQTERPPSFGTILTLVLTPIALIMLGTVSTNTLDEGSLLRTVLGVLGAPMIALLIAVVLCAYLLGARRGWSASHTEEVLSSALPPVALVILVSGAGGIFGKVLVKTGIGDAVSDVLQASGLPLLALAFLMTLVLRAAQGSATVALVTVGGLLAPLLKNADLSSPQLALVALAMGGGALALSHINDSGFWIFTKLVGINVPTALRTWTVLTTTMGLTAFALAAVAWPLV
ncbi:GntT/GntP/DsdX family permease [Streptomyces dysideae]|uniref:Transporter n=1 Tax=Streptomyces dysideae TaxID=909626 RepID=A0A117S226_9ACTN|nr:SLC13 family permease [Streptomyces dysideae]KUO22082.1 transporter [Streptomyces dysideae]